SQRSIKTPATGPTKNAGSTVAMVTPPTARPTQGWPLASCLNIHSRSVIVKNQSPSKERLWPAHSQAKLRLSSHASVRLVALKCAMQLLSSPRGRLFLACASEEKDSRQVGSFASASLWSAASLVLIEVGMPGM